MMEKLTCKSEPLTIEDGISIEAWLNKLGKTNDFLLAHAIDGVIWGKIEGGRLVTSATLNHTTLQELRLFNKQREIHLWSVDDAWYARLIEDKDGITPDDYIEEAHILWGTKGTPQPTGFTRLEDGAQGLAHHVPIDATSVTPKKRVRLGVRHYFGEDENGVNYIAYSRLTTLEVK